MSRNTRTLAIVIYMGLGLGGISRGSVTPTPGGSALLERVANAVWQVESSGRLHPPAGDRGSAVGPLQIWPIMVEECNRIAGEKRWTLTDRNDLEKSKAMFRCYVLKWFPNGTAEQWCRSWNGGPNGAKKAATKVYWLKIQKAMKGAK